MPTLYSTTPQLTNFIAFRQALYRQGFTQRRDAQFELLDALLAGQPLRSFAELSYAPSFRRTWSSVYAAVEDGRLDTLALRRLLVAQLPTQGVQVFALDSSAWPHPQARTLADRQHVHQATHAVNGGSVIVGHEYSLLCWVAQPASSWALPLDCERVPSSATVCTVGAQQVARLLAHRPAAPDPPLWVLVADGHYGNVGFLRAVRDAGGAAVVRLRRDRVLRRAPGAYGGRGRPPVHGPPFRFDEPATWPPPDQEQHLIDPHWGQVALQLWVNLHDASAADCPFSVLRVVAHQERAHRPAALWLGWRGPAQEAMAIWSYYQQRWPIEPSIRTRKQLLAWTRPRFQDGAACDRWSWLVSLAQWELYLARPLVADHPAPWQRPQGAERLTPARVQAGLGGLFAAIGSPAVGPQTRGKGAGWPRGRARQRRPPCPVVDRAPPRPARGRRRARASPIGR
jgi:hypothetical protein